MITGPITLESLLDKPLPIYHYPKDEYKDSIEALYEKEEGDENQDVVVIDKSIATGKKLEFIWNRGKSNANITDTGEGKFGFSFYYARYAYRDKCMIEVPELATDKRNTAFIAQIIDDSNIYKRSSEPIMLIIQERKNEDGFKRIVSAYFKSPEDWVVKFINKIRQAHRFSDGRSMEAYESTNPDLITWATEEYHKRSLAWEEANKLL